VSGARFSFVYPTRHRPEFIRQALAILALRPRQEVQVVVCDNYIDPALSCEPVCRDSGLANLTYARPPHPVGMVENWHHSLQFATGEYVSYLTDKMFVLPDAVEHLERAVDSAGSPEIVSWVSDAYHPDSYEDYFGTGRYWRVSSPEHAEGYGRYSPTDELNRRGRAEVSRTEQSSADYTRGKLAFGAYRRDLIQRIEARHGLFHNISPDYTSMVLGLAEARDAIELSVSGVVSVNTDISNGLLADTDDAYALGFLESLAGGAEVILPNLLVPGLYSSLHNLVAHDYLTLRTAFGLGFEFDTVNWLTYISEDIHRGGRRWSSPEAEAQQKGLLHAFLDALEPSTASAVRARIRERAKRAAPPRHVPLQRTWQRLTGTQPRPPDTSADPIQYPASSILAAVEHVVAARSMR
jgi:hypothetical protein